MLDINDYPDLNRLLLAVKTKAKLQFEDLTIWPDGRKAMAHETINLGKVNFELGVQMLQEKCENRKKVLYNSWINESGSEGMLQSLDLIKQIPDRELYLSVKLNSEVRAALVTALKSRALSEDHHATLFNAFLDTHREELAGIEANHKALERLPDFYDDECSDIFKKDDLTKKMRAAIETQVTDMLGEA